MKFKDYLAEITTKKAKWEVLKKSSNVFLAIISISNGSQQQENYDFRALRTTVKKILNDMDAEEEFKIKFGENILHTPMWEIAFFGEHSETYQVPKGANIAVQLFAAIEDIFKMFIIAYNPETFMFDSLKAEPSRIKLYDFLSKKITKKTKYSYTKIESNRKIYWVFV